MAGTRSIALDPTDWAWATWRKRPPFQTPTPTTFDLDGCLQRLASKVKASYAWEWDFARAELSPGMSKEEARFWFECMHSIDGEGSPAKKAEALRKTNFGALTLEGAQKALAKWGHDPAPEAALVLAVLFGPMGVTDMLLGQKPGSNGYHGGGDFFQGWRRFVLPQLGEGELAALRKRLGPRVTPKAFPTDRYKEPNGDFFVAACIGLHDELLAVVTSWADDRFEGEDWYDAYHVPQVMIFGLGSASLVSQQMRRLGLRLREPTYMRAWLAHTEHADLDWAAKTIVETKNKQRAAQLAEVLALVDSPENAKPMLDVATRSKAPKVGVAWLDSHVESAAAGLVEVAAGRGALADAATERLRAFKRSGHAAAIEATTNGSSDAAAKKAEALLATKERVLGALEPAPKWLAGPLAKASTLKAVKCGPGFSGAPRDRRRHTHERSGGQAPFGARRLDGRRSPARRAAVRARDAGVPRRLCLAPLRSVARRGRTVEGEMGARRDGSPRG